MKLFLTARSGNMKLNRKLREQECVDWDESGGFQVTPTYKSSNGKRGWKFSEISKHCTSHEKNIKGKTNLFQLLRQPQKSRRRLLKEQEYDTSNRTSLTQQQLKHSSRRMVVEQIPPETRVTLAYGDISSVPTCTTSGRTSVKTIEPDELTKRAMAKVILRQLLDDDEKTKRSQPKTQQRAQPKLRKDVHACDDGEDNNANDGDKRTRYDVETPGACSTGFVGVEKLSAMDLLFSCCPAEYPSTVPLTPTTHADRTIVTESSGYSSWLTTSFQSSGISSRSSW